jgi:hypothetical protein
MRLYVFTEKGQPREKNLAGQTGRFSENSGAKHFPVDGT